MLFIGDSYGEHYIQYFGLAVRNRRFQGLFFQLFKNTRLIPGDPQGSILRAHSTQRTV